MMAKAGALVRNEFLFDTAFLYQNLQNYIQTATKVEDLLPIRNNIEQLEDQKKQLSMNLERVYQSVQRENISASCIIKVYYI